jgi:hypothetical protein
MGGGNRKQPVGKINVAQYYILGQKFQWTWENSGLWQARNLEICGQLEAHFGSAQGEVDLTILQTSQIAMGSW